MITTALLAALAAAQAPADNPRRCIGVVVPISGLRAAVLGDEAVTALRRFARAHLADDPRTRYVIFAPYGHDRGADSNIAATQLRGDAVRAQLVAAGLPDARIRVIRLGEQGDYLFPASLDAAERAIERALDRAERLTDAASVIVERPPGATDC